MRIMYSTLENHCMESKAQPAAIPKHSMVWVEVAGTMYRLQEEQGRLVVSVDNQLVVEPRHANSARLRMEPFK